MKKVKAKVKKIKQLLHELEQDGRVGPYANEILQMELDEALQILEVGRKYHCLKCKEEVIYLDEDIDIMLRAEQDEGVFCSAECEYSFYNGGDGSDY